jgi:hypothetical protein
MRPYPPDITPLYKTRNTRSILTLPIKSTLGELKNAPFPRPFPPDMLLRAIDEIEEPKISPQIMIIEGSDINNELKYAPNGRISNLHLYKPITPTNPRHNRSIKTRLSIQHIRNKEQQNLVKIQKSIAKDLKKATEKLNKIQQTFKKKKKTYKISQSQSQKTLNDIERISNTTESLVNHIEELKMRKSITETMLKK